MLFRCWRPWFWRWRGPLLAALLLLAGWSAVFPPPGEDHPLLESQQLTSDSSTDQQGTTRPVTDPEPKVVLLWTPSNTTGDDGDGDRPPLEPQQLTLDSSTDQQGSTRPVADKEPRLVLLWTPFNTAGDDDDLLRPRLGGRSFEGCPVSSCEVTDDRTQLEAASAVLFDSSEMDPDFLPTRRRPEQKFVFFSMESPHATELDLTRLDGFFNLTMTYRSDSDIHQPFGETVAGGQTDRLPDFERRESAAVWMADGCSSQSRRELYVMQLSRYIPVNKAGVCGARDCDGDTADGCYRRQAARSLFALAFEDNLCDHLITDQFWRALRAGLVPVVRGPNLERYRSVAPPGSFIHVGQFAGPREVAQHLLALSRNGTGYQEYQAWRGTHHVRPGRWNGCDLCAELWRGTGEGATSSVRLSDVWSPRKHCRQPTDLGSHPLLDRLLKMIIGSGQPS